jgi:hypothetical protein
MSVSEAFSTVMKIRRVIVIISVLAGTGYKVAPMVMHKADAKPARPGMVAVKSTSSPTGNASNAANSNIAPPATSSLGCDLGEISLTNHYETCVSLGAGKDFIITPKMLDGHNVQLTLTVESKTAAGKTHDMTVTQVVARSGKPLEVAVGSFSFSLTPNVAADN